MWFIGVEVEQETSAPPPKKNPGSAPELWLSHFRLFDVTALIQTFSIWFFMGKHKPQQLQFAVTRSRFYAAGISNFSKAFIV